MNFRRLLNSETIVILLLFAVTVSAVGIMQERNGRINQCNDMGRVYTDNGECLTCEETGRIWWFGECVVNRFPEYSGVK